MSRPTRASEAIPDETLALGVVVTGVLVLAGSEGLHVAWLVVVAIASLLVLLRRPGPRESEDAPPTDTP